MKLSCCCGMLVGFVLAAVCGAAIYYYCYCKEHPGAAEEGMTKVEKSWEKTKNAGDKVIYTVKPYVKSAPESGASPSQPQVTEK